MSTKENKYSFVPLLQSKINQFATPSPDQIKLLKNFYLILKNQKHFIEYRKGLYLLFNTKQKEIGSLNFKIKTPELTLESPSENIQKEIHRFFSKQHKMLSINIYKKLKNISQPR